jgi:GNAT superfamily N-acetyltransferase
MLRDQASIENIGERFARQNGFVAKINGVVVGVVSVFRDTISQLFVDPDQHRRGVGAALFKNAQE